MKFIKENIEEILIISGLSLIVCATFLINLIAGIYCLGIILFLFGAFLLKYPKR